MFHWHIHLTLFMIFWQLLLHFSQHSQNVYRPMTYLYSSFILPVLNHLWFCLVIILLVIVNQPKQGYLVNHLSVFSSVLVSFLMRWYHGKMYVTMCELCESSWLFGKGACMVSSFDASSYLNAFFCLSFSLQSLRKCHFWILLCSGVSKSGLWFQNVYSAIIYE